MTTQQDILDCLYQWTQEALRQRDELQMTTKEYKEGQHEEFIAEKGVK